MSESVKILMIEDDESLAWSLMRLLLTEGFEVELAPSVERGLLLAREFPFTVVVTDLQMPGDSAAAARAGLDLIHELRAIKPQLPIILMTAHHTTETAIEAAKLGAYDYLLKPFDPQDLLNLISKAVAASRPPAPATPPPAARAVVAEAIIGKGRAMQTVLMDIGRLAAKPVIVLIRGETGTGKELVARALYKHSERADKPFITVNCVAIPETLLESELFGHEQGAFTGATARRIGRFEQADYGTIFLDEIGDMTLSTQAKLLRVLQEKTIQRLGGKEPIAVDVRIMAATHRDLEQAIKEKLFREDLYYRLNIGAISLPPLRERREDIPSLVQHFLHRYGAELGAAQSSISAEALLYLQQQPWPGNVRELENVVRKALLLARGYTIDREMIKQALAHMHPPRPAADQSLTSYIADMLKRAATGELPDVQAAFSQATERELYAQAIELAQGNQAKAAKWLGVSRPTMREKLIQYGLHPSASKAQPDPDTTSAD